MITPLHLGVLHLGALHPVEQAATLALAFGPFAVLGVVIFVRRRHEDDETSGGTAGETAGGTAEETTGEPQRDK